MASRAPRGFFDRIVHTTVDTFPASQMRVSLHTAPPSSEFGDCVREVPGEGYSRAGGTATWTPGEPIEWELHRPGLVVLGVWEPDPEDELTERSWDDATPAGIGDPFAGLMRTIDELLEDE